MTEEELRYRRSSLHLILIETESFPQKETVIDSYFKMEFPDQYNNHNIEAVSVDLKKYGYQNPQSASDDQAASWDADRIPDYLNKYIKDVKLANQLVAKWFNRSEDGCFDMKLIQERGYYNASELEAAIAQGQTRGMSSLGDAGEELIQNTFVIFSKLFFLSNEPFARIARDLALTEAEVVRKAAMDKAEDVEKETYNQARAVTNEILRDMAMEAAEKAVDRMYEAIEKKSDQAVELANRGYNKAKEGYSVWTNSWLYKLEWTNEIAATFYNTYWMDKTSIRPEKGEAFETADLFNLVYIGNEKTKSMVTFSFNETRTEREVIELSTIRNLESTFAKLQKKFEVFRPKVPVMSVDPIRAQIGKKEGLEGGERFDVLEMTKDPKTGRTAYKKICQVKVADNQIWDNRFNAGHSGSYANAGGMPGTTFKGSGKIQPGMLLKQVR